MFLLNKKNTTKYGVVIEVGSGSVAAAIVSSNETASNPVVLFTTREFLPLKQTVAIEDVSKRLLNSLLSVALEVESKVSQFIPKHEKLSAVHVTFTAPWSDTKGKTHTHVFEKPQVVTNKILLKIVNETDNTSDQTSPTEDVKKRTDVTSIDRIVTGYTANSYTVSNPVGQTVKTLTITEATSTVSNIVFPHVQDIVNKLFVDVAVKYSTSTHIQQQLLRELDDTPSNFATAHLTYEAIEVALYRDNKISATYTSPIGINTIARNIAKKTKLSHEQVLGFLLAYDTASYQEKVIEKIQNGFKEAMSGELQDFFIAIQYSELLPRDFYLITTLLPSVAITNMISDVLDIISGNKFVLRNLQTPAVQSGAKFSLSNNDLGICTLAYFFHNNPVID